MIHMMVQSLDLLLESNYSAVILNLFNKKLEIAKDATAVVRVTYETTKDAQAINWLTEA